MKPATLAKWAQRLRVLRETREKGGRVISLDPSSKCAGVAVHEIEGASSRLVAAARIEPKPKSAPPYRRVDQITDSVVSYAETYRAQVGVIEVTTGKTSSRHGGRGAGLAVYGVAVGAVRHAMRGLLGAHHVVDIYENEWTARTTKHERWLYCKSVYPSFAELWSADEGDYDASDATYLYHWSVEQMEPYVSEQAQA